MSWIDNNMNLSPTFTDHNKAAEYINNNFDLLVVGSDEVWKLGIDGVKYPSVFFGYGVTIRKIAVAVSTDGLNVHKLPTHTKSQLQKSLREFSAIYVRDSVLALDINVDGILPDPTFAMDFPATNRLPTDSQNPVEWFASMANMEYCETDRMHVMLACLRGGTPCHTTDKRTKSAEIIQDFQLPQGKREDIERMWPHESIRCRCEQYKNQWQEFIKNVH